MRKMKDSGIEWIGEIPEEWRITTIGKLFFAKAGGDAKTALYVDEKDNDHPYPVYTNAFDEKQVYAYTSLPVFPKNSITVTGRGDIGHAILRKTEFDAIIRLNVLTSKFNLCEKYFVYFIDTVTPFFTNSAAVGQLSATQITSYNICFPPLPEQQAIAAHLDRVCAEIDSITAKTKATIEEYKKLKQAIITQAVTKGIRKGRKMKDSGSVWFDTIPFDWNFIKLKYHFKIKKEIAGQEGYTVLSITQKGIIPKNISSNEGQLAADYSNYQLVNSGDFAMNHMDLLTGWVDISRFDGVTSPDYRVFVIKNPDLNDSRYFLFLMQVCYMNKIFYGLGQGVSGLGRWRLQADKFLNFYIPIPPKDEQHEIVTFLDEKCSEIDKLIAKKEQLLTQLESYKKSVIYEYVTGKKKVVNTSAVVINPLVEQALLLCKIKDCLGDELKGRIQALKCLYLIENFVGINFNTQYFRYKHGPYTPNIENIEKCCMNNGWLTVSRDNHYEYYAGRNYYHYSDEYVKLFDTNNSDIEKVLFFIKGMKTSEAERVATLFAVWNDMIIEGKTSPSDSEIIYEVRNNWTPNKAHSPESTWQNTLDKMKKAGIIPKGYGLHTKKKENENEQL